MASEISASRFKEQCLSLIDHLDPDGLVITKHGRPVARVLPASNDCRALIGSFKGKIRPKGNLRSTGVKWDAKSWAIIYLPDQVVIHST